MRCRAVMLIGVTGCSLVTVRGAPNPDPGYRPLDCTESIAAPVLDAVPATLGLLLTGAVLVDVSNDPPGNEGRELAAGLVAIVFGIPAVILAASALYGFKRTATCRELNRTPPRLIPMPMPMQPQLQPQPIAPPPPPSPAPISPGAGSQVEPTF